MVSLNGALVGTQQPSLYERGHTVHSRKQFVGFSSRAFHRSTVMHIVSEDSARIGTEPIRQNLRTLLNMRLKEESQGRRLGVGNHLEAAPTEAFGSYLLHRNGNENLPLRSSSTLARPDAANKHLVHFDNATESLSSRTYHGAAEPVQHCPSSLVGTKAKQPMKRLRRNTILPGHHVPSCRKPYRKGRLTTVKNRSSRYRDSASAVPARPATIGKTPSLQASAVRTQKTCWPSQPIQVITTCILIRKPCQEFGKVPWVVLSCTRIQCFGR